GGSHRAAEIHVQPSPATTAIRRGEAGQPLADPAAEMAALLDRFERRRRLRQPHDGAATQQQQQGEQPYTHGLMTPSANFQHEQAAKLAKNSPGSQTLRRQAAAQLTASSPRTGLCSGAYR